MRSARLGVPLAGEIRYKVNLLHFPSKKVLKFSYLYTYVLNRL